MNCLVDTLKKALTEITGGQGAGVVNRENRRAILVRVNDCGPFVDGRIIDVSAGVARNLGFYDKGTARVLVEAVEREG